MWWAPEDTASKHRQLQDYLSWCEAPVGAHAAAQGQCPPALLLHLRWALLMTHIHTGISTGKQTAQW